MLQAVSIKKETSEEHQLKETFLHFSKKDSRRKTQFVWK
jgi:hypothetical protein